MQIPGHQPYQRVIRLRGRSPGPHGRVGPQRLIDPVPAGHHPLDQTHPVERLQQAQNRPDPSAVQRGSRLRREIAPGMQPEQPEQSRGVIGER
ncbi:hypothetical protein [Acrocarpospora sp. B8E8]|uniref:hypothetical protein n=1 Tax=Acrocarpospora sp. B8E8 TaxID=3153572 RepID=UPI00325DF125